MCSTTLNIFGGLPPYVAATEAAHGESDVMVNATTT